MARTKGAKGKKTLAKEAGMTLEEYEAALKAGIRPEHFSGPLEGQEELKLPEEELKLPEKESLEIEPDPEELNTAIKEAVKTIDKINKIFLQNKSFSDPTSDTQEEEKLNGEKNTKENIFVNSKSIKKKSVMLCERCHKEILDSPKKINLTYLTGQAPWRRQLNKDILNLCHECSNKLSLLVEEFLWDEGKGVGLKYGAEKLEREEN